MLLSALKTICLAYHNKTPPDVALSGSNDAFIIAANNVRKRAEMLHNFESAWCKGTLSVTPTNGGLLTATTIVPISAFQGVKEIISVAQSQNGAYVPIILRRPNQEAYARTIPRIPTDGDVLSTYNGSYLILRGDALYKYPDDGTGSAVTVYLECYGWLNDYVAAQLDLASGNIDFFMQYGHEYMMWGIILELNYMFQSFVFRQEGNPGAPEKKMEAAWDALVQWDSYRVTPHISDDR